MSLGTNCALPAGRRTILRLTLLVILERRPGDLDLLVAGGCVGDFERAGAEHGEAIAVVRSGSDAVGAKAGPGVIDFEELNIGAGAVLDGRVDVVGVAGGDRKESRAECKCDGR